MNYFFLHPDSKRKHSYQIYIALLLSAFFMLVSCADQKGKYHRDSKEYGITSENFTGSWWDYYERGRSYSDGKFYTEAISDFQQAIKGSEEDKWHARTNDTHFMDYFPHRELGVVYYQKDLFSKAISELEFSIGTAPSAKAHYFLNKARAAKLRLDGTDTSAPEITVQGTVGQIITNKFSHTVSGVVIDDTYVASITVGDKQVPIELAQKYQKFSIEMALKPGQNIIQVIATDLLGKSSETKVEILCDRSGPLIEILQINDVGTSKIVSGVVSDEGGLKSLLVNGIPWNITGAFDAYGFKFDITKNIHELVATDKAGNVTRALLDEEYMDTDQLLTIQIAPLETYSNEFSESYQPLRAANTSPSVEDKDPPFIKLGDISPVLVTYDNFILLKGEVIDLSPIHSLSIDGEPISNNNGKKIYFSLLQKLEEGNNEFVVVAIDVHGNKAEKKISIERKVKNINQIINRMSVAVLPFNHKSDESTIGELIHDQMIDSILEQKRFNVVEHKGIDSVLRELKLSSTELADPDQTADIGRIVAANAILVGTVIESPESVEIIGRLIDTETATILSSNDIFGEDKSFSALGNLIDSLTFKFKKDFPLVEGIVIEVKDKEVLLNIGKDQKIKQNQMLICFRDEIEMKHPVTGRIIGGEPEILTVLKINEVFEKTSKARLSSYEKIKPFDRVITK